jgi:hypothetical protein
MAGGTASIAEMMQAARHQMSVAKHTVLRSFVFINQLLWEL